MRTSSGGRDLLSVTIDSVCTSTGLVAFYFCLVTSLYLQFRLSCLFVYFFVTCDSNIAMLRCRAFPWRGSRSSNLNGMSEEVRPINWANRPKAYIKRTITWDEFPNGRWGDNRSPAFGELSDSHFFRPVEGSKEDLLAMWGDAPITHSDVYEVFAKYVEGKIPILPWCEVALHGETLPISGELARINRSGFLTINSQPAVNGVKSSHPVYGWGGLHGRVYQKAYVEFFTTPEMMESIMSVVASKPSLNFYAINNDGVAYSSGQKGVTALTWGVFPNKEIAQPTVFDPDSFGVWSQETFQLWTKCWASLYDDETESCALLYEVGILACRRAISLIACLHVWFALVYFSSTPTLQPPLPLPLSIKSPTKL